MNINLFTFGMILLQRFIRRTCCMKVNVIYPGKRPHMIS